jgi:hypothetical protein
MSRWIRAAMPLFIVLFVVAFVGCEGDEGPIGPAGPPGPPGGVSDYTYFGGGGEACLHCHASTVFTWEETGHQNAFADLGEADRANLYCVRCHTTGFDSQVAFGDTEVAPGNEGPDVNGYDDYVGVDTPEAAARRAALEGVQCEACHGPMGPVINDHGPLISFSSNVVDGKSTSLCNPCHETQLEEWGESGHGNAAGGDVEAFNDEFSSSSCKPCHTSEGFIARMDPAYADYVFPEEVSFIGCPTCHDPHMGEESRGGNEYQLRSLAAVEVEYHPGLDPGDDGVPAMEGYGTAQVCAQCHHGRRNTAHVQGQIADGYDHFGPHESPQMDMFIGAGCYEIAGYTYNGSSAHQAAVSDACVECHMQRVEVIHGESQEHAFHTFEPDPGNCLPCHTITDFNYKNVQTEIQGKMDAVAQALGYADAATMMESSDFNFGVTTTEVWQREAAYAVFFVAADGSKGVHNSTYARSLLDNALAHIQAQ